MKKSILLFVITLCVCACSINIKMPSGSRIYTTTPESTKTITGNGGVFEEIITDVPGKIIVSQGDKYSYSITASTHNFENIKLSMGGKDKKLEVSRKNKQFEFDDTEIIIQITTTGSVKSVKNRGMGAVDIYSPVREKRFDLYCFDEGEINAYDIEADEVGVFSGGSHKLEGRTDRLILQIGGKGIADLTYLSSNWAKINMTGKVTAYVSVKDTAIGEMAETSKLYYYQVPENLNIVQTEQGPVVRENN